MSMTEYVAEKFKFDRPQNTDLPPVTIPSSFSSHWDVATFRNRHNAVLTWPQLETLVEHYERLQIEHDKRESRGRIQNRHGATEQALIDAWATARTHERQNDRLNAMATVAAGLMGDRSAFATQRVFSVYAECGLKPTNRAIISLVGENIEPSKRMQYLKHRATQEMKAS